MWNVWFNIRFDTYHWQWGSGGITWRQNPTHVEWKKNNPDTWKWFAVYVFFGFYI
jgi:hypothetical protein